MRSRTGSERGNVGEYSLKGCRGNDVGISEGHHGNIFVGNGSRNCGVVDTKCGRRPYDGVCEVLMCTLENWSRRLMTIIQKGTSFRNLHVSYTTATDIWNS